jgi:hypothetical protein
MIYHKAALCIKTVHTSVYTSVSKLAMHIVCVAGRVRAVVISSAVLTCTEHIQTQAVACFRTAVPVHMRVNINRESNTLLHTAVIHCSAARFLLRLVCLHATISHSHYCSVMLVLALLLLLLLLVNFANGVRY